MDEIHNKISQVGHSAIKSISSKKKFNSDSEGLIHSGFDIVHGYAKKPQDQKSKDDLQQKTKDFGHAAISKLSSHRKFNSQNENALHAGYELVHGFAHSENGKKVGKAIKEKALQVADKVGTKIKSVISGVHKKSNIKAQKIGALGSLLNKRKR